MKTTRLVARLRLLLILPCFALLLGACSSDKCISCSFTDPETGEDVTKPRVCGDEDHLEGWEMIYDAEARQQKSFIVCDEIEQ